MNPTTRMKLAPATLAFAILGACASSSTAVPTKEIASQRSGDLVVSLRNEKGELAQGQNQFVVAFRSGAKNELVNVGTVTLSSSMAMPGMAPMTAAIELEPSGNGEYKAKGDFAMSGAWRFEARWDGPAGKGTTSFSSNVR